MRIGVISDTHGSAGCWAMVCKNFFCNVDLIFHAGDVLYHGPRNDLPRDYAPKEVTAMLTGLDVPILGVRGNCDAEIDQTVLGFPLLSDFALLLYGMHTIFVTHGHLYTPDQHPALRRGDAFLSGHIHVPVCEERDAVLYLNPGSASMPKENTSPGCMTFENGVFRWIDMEGECWKEYRWED